MKNSAFILIGRKEKAGNTSRPGSFHQAHCFNVGEGATSSSKTTWQHQHLCTYMSCFFKSVQFDLGFSVSWICSIGSIMKKFFLFLKHNKLKIIGVV